MIFVLKINNEEKHNWEKNYHNFEIYCLIEGKLATFV